MMGRLKRLHRTLIPRQVRGLAALYRSRRAHRRTLFEITPEAARCITGSGDENGRFEPLGSFWVYEDGKYVAIDNTAGGALCEDFDSRLECFCWLLGDYEKWELDAWKKCGRLHGLKMALFSLNGRIRLRLPEQFRG